MLGIVVVMIVVIVVLVLVEIVVEVAWPMELKTVVGTCGFVAFGVIVVDINRNGVLFGCPLGGMEDEMSVDVGFWVEVDKKDGPGLSDSVLSVVDGP